MSTLVCRLENGQSQIAPDWSPSQPYTGIRTPGETPFDYCNGPFAAFGSLQSQHQMFEDEVLVVIVDGVIDNCNELGQRLGLTTTPGPAELVARLVSRQGPGWLDRIEGHYSLVIFDKKTRTLQLVRDILGTRPLFYGRTENGWIAGSELKLILPFIQADSIDPDGLTEDIWYRWMPGRNTLIKGVSSVVPCTAVTLGQDPSPRESVYYRLTFKPQVCSASDTLDHWADHVEKAFDEYYAKLRNHSDSIGVFLSGGVDSALLSQFALRAGFKNVIAYTATCEGQHPELDSASFIARSLEIPLNAVDTKDSWVTDYLPNLVWRMEELPRHYNSFPLLQLARAAEPDVRMVLHGEAAGAVFGSGEYRLLSRFTEKQGKVAALPKFVKSFLAALLRYGQSNARAERIYKYLTMTPDEFLLTTDRIEYSKKGAAALNQDARNPGIHGASCLQHFLDRESPRGERFQKLHLYTFCYSHMVYLDRLCTPSGLRVVMPFLSPEVVSIFTRLPSELKLQGSVTKPVIKHLACRYFPEEWVHQKKMGFPTPSSRWIRLWLERWGYLLDSSVAERHGLVRASLVKELDPDRDMEAIFSVLCLEIFLRLFLEQDQELLDYVQTGN